MGAFLVRRLISTVVVFFFVTVAIFGLVHAAPGDPVAQLIPPSMYNSGSQEFIEQKRHELGLDLPLPVQYLHWLGNALHGDLGYSIGAGRPVGEMITERVVPTIELMGLAILVGLVLALPLGTLAALRKNRGTDYVATFVSLIAVSTPSFFLGILAIYVFALKLQVLPSAGMSTPGNGTGADLLVHLVLPVLILGLGMAGQFTRYIRSSMLSELGSEYVRTGVAKGMSMGGVLVKHVLRNALIPIITVVALSIPALLGGAVVVEQVFAWPGMGQLAITAVTAQDYSVIIAFALMVSILVLVSNLIADLLYAVVDPRVVLK